MGIHIIGKGIVAHELQRIAYRRVCRFRLFYVGGSEFHALKAVMRPPHKGVGVLRVGEGGDFFGGVDIAFEFFFVALSGIFYAAEIII